MKPQLLALLTAIAWGVGGYFEKKGLKSWKFESSDGDHDPDGSRADYFGSNQLSPMENRLTCRQPFIDDAVYRWCSGRLTGHAVLLCCNKRSPTITSDADRFHSSPLRCVNRDPVWR